MNSLKRSTGCKSPNVPNEITKYQIGMLNLCVIKCAVFTVDGETTFAKTGRLLASYKAGNNINIMYVTTQLMKQPAMGNIRTRYAN